MPKVHLLDYVAGNIRSLVNAIEKCGWEVEWIRSPHDVEKAEVSPSLTNLCELYNGLLLFCCANEALMCEILESAGILFLRVPPVLLRQGFLLLDQRGWRQEPG